MISFNFGLCLYDAKDVSPFEMGHIDIVNDGIIISSRDKHPDQSMMIFLSVTDLLDKVRKILSSKSLATITFSSTDSSFELLLKSKGNTITIMGKISSIQVKKGELANSLYENASEFYNKYGQILEEIHQYYDLKNSISDFANLLE
ncbi:MAG: hypothetical protein EOO61_18005 [Hymenobacter sp.]|nr:MAG: hypothetical protein EOO61_18005 [Hymenobacter sp.]